MKKSSCFIVAVSLFCSAAVFGQQENVDTAAFRKIRNAEMSNSHIAWIAHYLTDVAGPRLTNSPGYMRAADWAVNTMKGWGLSNAAREPWGEYGRGWEAGEFSMTMTAPYHQALIGYAVPWSSNTGGTVRGQVVLLKAGNLSDSGYVSKHMVDFKGKFVLIDNGRTTIASDLVPFATRLTDSELMKLPDSYMVDGKMIAYYKKLLKKQDENLAMMKTAGALALLGANGRDGTVTVQSFQGFKTGSPEGLPEVAIDGPDGLKIKRLIASGQPVELALNLQGTFNSDDTKGYNVVAEIPGTDPKLKAQLVMLGGHLDSWTAGTGATDNGAGCIVMMEAVRLLDSLQLRPRRTIRIALWGGEEEGLLGSYGYVKKHYGDAETAAFRPEQQKVSVYFNLDNGTGKIRGIYAQQNAPAKAIFEQWFVPFHDLGAKTVTISNTGSTDHLSFDWEDIPGFQFVQDPLDYETKTHHTNMDTYDYLRIDDMKQAAIIVASFVYQAANRPAMMPRKAVKKEKFAFDGF